MGDRPPDVRPADGEREPVELTRDRRAFLSGVATTGALVFLATAGNTISPLSKLAALAQRRPGTGPQGLPVNKSAVGAGVVDTAQDPDYRLRIVRRGHADRRAHARRAPGHAPA